MSLVTRVDFVGIPTRDLSTTSPRHAPSSSPRASSSPWTRSTGVCHMAFFEDPDGDALMLHHNYVRSSTAASAR
jgi:hypothetical protein